MSEDMKNNACFASRGVSVDDYWKSRGIHGVDEHETGQVENLRASAWKIGEKSIQSD